MTRANTPRGTVIGGAGFSRFSIDRAILAFAGIMVLGSLALGVWLSPWFLLLTALVGLNLLQSAFTGFCPAAMLLRRLGLRPGAAFH